MQPPDLLQLHEQLSQAEQDLRMLVTGLPTEVAHRQPGNQSWSVAQCVEHLALTNENYVDSMEQAADKARQQRRMRRRPALPGFLGRWFIASLEPPVRRIRIKTSPLIEPRPSVSLNGAWDAFTASQERVYGFLGRNGDLDLASVAFRNPFIPGVRFSVATGLHIIASHERRHLWQAQNARRVAEEEG